MNALPIAIAGGALAVSLALAGVVFQPTELQKNCREFARTSNGHFPAYALSDYIRGSEDREERLYQMCFVGTTLRGIGK